MRGSNNARSLCVLLLILGGLPALAQSTSLEIAIDTTNSYLANFYNFTKFHSDYEDAGSFVSIIPEFQTISSSIDAYLMLAPNNFTTPDMNEITSWFNDDTLRFLWIGADSDFGSNFSPNTSNTILREIGSHIRVSDEGVLDDTYNDGAPYRVIATRTHQDGNLNSIFGKGVDSSVFHGPAPLYLEKGNQNYHPSSVSINNVEVVLSSSNLSYMTDYPGTPPGYYTSMNYTGSTPLLMVERIDSQRFVVVSGETIWSDYKNMYGVKTENNIWGDHQGKVLVDNILEWYESYEPAITIPPSPAVPIATMITVMIIVRTIYYKIRPQEY